MGNGENPFTLHAVIFRHRAPLSPAMDTSTSTIVESPPLPPLPLCVFLVNLRGSSPFVSFCLRAATMASGDVDLCLVPESPIVLDGPGGCIPHLMKRVSGTGKGLRLDESYPHCVGGCALGVHVMIMMMMMTMMMHLLQSSWSYIRFQHLFFSG